MTTITRFLKLPLSVRGLTVTDPDGNYNVYINQNHAHEMQLETYQHEITHIKGNDFQKTEPVAILEEQIKYCKD